MSDIIHVGDERRRPEKKFAAAAGHLEEADSLDMYDGKEMHHLALGADEHLPPRCCS
jgi:hypothetical protein